MSGKSALKRNSICISKKISIIDAVDRGDKSKQEIAKQFNVPASTLSTILKNREQICNNKFLKSKRQRVAEYPELEECLVKWFRQCRNQNIPLGGPMVKLKAQQFAERLGYKEFKQSNGWLDNFKKRYNIIFRTVSGESASVSDEVCSNWKTLLPSLLKEYEPDNIFNADETGLFYKCFPEQTLAFKNEKCHGGKHSKERLSILFTVNSTGTEKRKLLIIGKSAKPRCFKNIKSLPVDYTANKNAWMTNNIWSDYLQKFDKEMTKANRKILLIVDNWPAHKNYPVLESIKIQFLPANTTSKLQPLDLGIIKNFKHYYRAEVVKIVLNDLEEGRKSSINILQGIRMAYSAWTSIKKTTISNCFATCGFIDSLNNTISITSNVCLKDSDEWEMLKNHFNLSEKFNDFVSFDDNLAHTGSLTDDDIVKEISQENEEQEEQDDVELEEVITASEAKTIVGKLQTYLEAQDSIPQEIFENLASIEKIVKHHISNSRKQTKITQFFVKN